MDIVKSSCIRRVYVVVLKRRKRRRVALNVTLKARAFFCVDVEKENGVRKSKRRRRDFLRKKNRARVSGFIRDGIYIEYRVSILSRLKRLLRFQSEKRDFVRHRFFVDQVPGFI